MKNSKPKTVISARVTVDVMHRLKKRALKEKRTVSAIVSAIVARHA